MCIDNYSNYSFEIYEFVYRRPIYRSVSIFEKIVHDTTSVRKTCTSTNTASRLQFEQMEDANMYKTVKNDLLW